MEIIGTTLDKRFEITKQLGSGGMAEVFLAHDLEYETEVAIKIVFSSDVATPAFLQRFKREFDICSSLNHTNIVKLYSYGKMPDNSSLYYAMEYLPCKDLKQMLTKKGKLRPSQVRQIVLQLARAFSYYHPRNIVHRDLKPDNIMVKKNGRVVIMDFGLVWDSSRTQLTKTGNMVGTPMYMSPELICRGKIDHRSDIFQLGSIAHECLCGKTAFQGKTVAKVAVNIINGKYTPIRKIDDSISKNWESFLLKCLEHDPERRFQSAEEVLTEVQNLSLPSTDSLKGGRSKGTVSVGRASCLDNSTLGLLKNSAINAISVLVDKEDKKEGIQGRFKATITNPSKKRIPYVFGMLALSILGSLCLLHSLYGSSPKMVVHSLRVTGGRETALIIFTSNNRLSSPDIELTNGTSTQIYFEQTTPQIHETCMIKGRKEFSHSLIISGLSENSRYSMSLLVNLQDNETLERKFSTKDTAPQLKTKFNKNGDLQVYYQSNTPFLSEEPRQTTFDDHPPFSRTKGHLFQKMVTVPFNELKKNTIVELKVTTIDKDIISSSERTHTLLAQCFDNIANLFEQTRKRKTSRPRAELPFFSTWIDISSNNFFFDEAGTEYSTINTEEKKAAFSKSVWKEVEEKLIKECLWYKELDAMLPGLPSFYNKCKISNSLRQKIAKALTGLELLQSAAVAATLPENPKWDTVTNWSSRPFRCSNKPLYSSIGLKIDTTRYPEVLYSPPLPFNIIYDMEHRGNRKLKDSKIFPFLSTHSYKFVVPHNLSDFSKAEVAFDIRACDNPAVLILLSFNNSKFTASLRVSPKIFDQYKLELVTVDVLKDAFASYLALSPNILLGKQKDGTLCPDTSSAIANCREVMIAIDKEAVPLADNCIHHPLPISILKKGENKISLTILNGPSSSVTQRLTYKTIKILLSH